MFFEHDVFRELYGAHQIVAVSKVDVPGSVFCIFRILHGRSKSAGTGQNNDSAPECALEPLFRLVVMVSYSGHVNHATHANVCAFLSDPDSVHCTTCLCDLLDMRGRSHVYNLVFSEAHLRLDV